MDPVFKTIEFEIDLVTARLDRSEVHYRSFGRIWEDYLDLSPHYLDYAEEDDGSTAVRLHRTKPLPIELSLAFGELLYELRAALDNCLYAVAVLVSGQNPPPSAARLEWPIRFTAAEWQSQQGRYRDLPGRITDALEQIQPYQAECPGWNSLGILHELARVDRHRSMHGLGLYLADFRLLANKNHIEVLGAGAPRVVVDGDEIVRIRVEEGGELSADNFDLDLVFDVDVTDVSESRGPLGDFGRPWGPLDARLRSIINATREYTSGLLEIAADYVHSDDEQL